MARLPRLLFCSLAMSAVLPLAVGAAQLHWPLPPNSHARNGTPQKMESHTHLPRQEIVLPKLPDRGLHPKAAQGLKRRYSGTPTDVLRYHNDNYPTGWNPNETDLTPATVGSANFGQLTTLKVRGNVLAEPLMVSNFQMPDGSAHNVLVVATGDNMVYAYDAQDYSLLWQVHLGPPQSVGDVGCDDIKPEYGISSTPVIVRNGSAATIYLIAATEPAYLSFHTKLHALDLGTGADVMKPVEIDPRAKLTTGEIMHLDPQNQWNRSALAYNNGAIYVSIGSHCDHHSDGISGWELRYDASTLKLTGKFNTIEARPQDGYELSSIWMSGYSPAIDPDGNVFAVTGNGNYNAGRGMKGYGESVISLAPDLSKKSVHNFTPSDWQSLNTQDADFGSGGAMLIPVVSGQTAPPMVIAMGKDGTAYLLDASHLRGLEGHNGYQALQTIPIGPCWCGPAYYGSASGGIVYYQGGGALHAYSVDTNKGQLAEIATSNDSGGGNGSFPVVSSNGTADNTAMVWAIERGNPTERLEAYNAMSLGAPLFAANAGSWSNGNRSYLTPLVANGRVYVPAYRTVAVFGLTN